MIGWGWIFVFLWLVPSWKLGQNREVATYTSNPGHLGEIVIEVTVYLPALSLEIALWLPTSLTSSRVVYCRSWLSFLGSSLQAVGQSSVFMYGLAIARLYTQSLIPKRLAVSQSFRAPLQTNTHNPASPAPSLCLPNWPLTGGPTRQMLAFVLPETSLLPCLLEQALSFALKIT